MMSFAWSPATFADPPSTSACTRTPPSASTTCTPMNPLRRSSCGDAVVPTAANAHASTKVLVRPIPHQPDEAPAGTLEAFNALAARREIAFAGADRVARFIHLHGQ